MTEPPSPAALRAFLHAFAESGYVTPWRDYRRALTAAPVAVTVVLAGACGGGTVTDAASVGEGNCTGDDCATECEDGTDNDSDGLIDCEDESCADMDVCAANPFGGTAGIAYGIPYEEDCDDRVDNDSDGQVDCADADCACGSGGSGGAGGAEPTGGVPSGGSGDGGVPSGGAESMGGLPLGGFPTGGVYGTGGYLWEYSCDDRIDNDSDGLVDCEDTDCTCGSGGSGGAGGAEPTGGVPSGGYGFGGANGIPMGGTPSGIPTGGSGDGGMPNGGADPGGADPGGAEAMGGLPLGGFPTGGVYGTGGYLWEYSCDDRIDNDSDGQVDCEDVDCCEQEVCALSPHCDVGD